MRKTLILGLIALFLAGCGTGELVRYMARSKNTTGLGSPQDIHNRQCLQSGFDISKVGGHCEKK